MQKPNLTRAFSVAAVSLCLTVAQSFTQDQKSSAQPAQQQSDSGQKQQQDTSLPQPDPHLQMESHIGKLTGHAENANMNYRRYCAGCHGDLGNAEGENAQWLDPKPRNFTLGIYKCRSTPTGTLPTDTDLYNTIGRGLISSNMPQWLPLTDQERADLVAKVKSFSPRFAKEKPGDPIQIPPEPAITPEHLKNGKAVFDRVQCWKCHGYAGRGDGPSAPTLQDDLNQPIKAYNFHDTTRFKCGTSDEDLYRIFMTGLDGTPMPSWSDNIKPEEAWDLVMYLRTLQPMHTKEKELAKKIGLKPTPPGSTPAPTAK